MRNALFRQIYSKTTDDDADDIACDQIPEEACADVPGNYSLNAFNGACTKLAEDLASPGLVVALLLAAMSAPVALVGFLEPVRRGLATLPQLVVSGRMRAVPQRKWFWVAAGVIQAVSLGAMAILALTARGTVGGVAVLTVLAVFSMASGMGSVAFSDVVGKTVPKKTRGQLLALRAAAGGALTLLVGGYLSIRLHGMRTPGDFVPLLWGAAALWLLAAVLFGLIREVPGATTGGRDALAEARAGLAALLRLPRFRWFLLARGMLIAVELALPYYALSARQSAGGGSALGVYILSIGAANLLGNPVWGRLADRRSSRLVMGLSGAVSALASAVALALALGSGGLGSGGGSSGGGGAEAAFALTFFLGALAQAGVRLGRKTYLVNAAPAGERPLFVATANTIAGALILAFGLLGFLAQGVGVAAVLALLLVLGLAGIWAAWRMSEDLRMVQPEARPLTPVS